MAYDRNALKTLTRDVIPKDSFFWKSPSPVLWIAANDLATNPQTFYSQAADALKLHFIDDIPVSINDSKSIAARLGPQVLSSLQFFPFIQKDKKELTIACADPFRADEMITACQPLTLEGTKTTVVMAPLSTIRSTIAVSVYQESAQSAENTLIKKDPTLSSRGALSVSMRWRLGIATLLFFIILFLKPPLGFLIFFLAVNAAYFVLNPLRLAICLAGLRNKVDSVALAEVKKLDDSRMPIYTILVPAKDEATMVPKLMQYLQKIDYPKDRLDIKLITEVTDASTLKAFAHAGADGKNLADMIHTVFEVIKVPIGQISTKPRSCNYALQFSRGRVTVIYDAEDRPDPLQLKKAYAALLDEKLNTLCMQAKLNFYNTKQNVLTQFFSLEYGFWYDFLLPGLQQWHIPLPLGGTSNHFLTETLRQVGTWDPYNVTEDADLGWRLSRLGYRTAILDSYTLEEANSQIWNWIRQRTRWQKGFLLTTLVHASHPIRLWKELGFYGLVSSVTIFTTNFLLPLINPVLWIFFICWYAPPLFGWSPIGFYMPGWLHTLGTINLTIGNGIFIAIYAIAAIGKKQWSQLPLVPFMPLYWLLLSVAAYRSVYQALTKPYSWEKTKHGLTTNQQ